MTEKKTCTGHRKNLWKASAHESNLSFARAGQTKILGMAKGIGKNNRSNDHVLRT
jgi:hypothetical protein